MANEEVLGPRKTMFVLVIVVGCFAVLWPRILSPLLLGPSRDQLKPNQRDREAGCCEVIFESEVAVLELMNEVCSLVVGATGSLSPYALAECRKAVNETCGFDIAAFLKRSDNVGKTTKVLLDTMKNSNSSCLKEHFGVPVWSLSTHPALNSWTIQDKLKQERPMRGMGPHPALRERGRAIPAGAPTPPSRGPVAMPPHVRVRSSPLSVYFELDIKPPPIPGMRPPLGSPGGPVPAPKTSMGFVMPIYTICIIVFFVYTLSKILFKRTGTSPYEHLTPDPQFHRRVFRDDSRTSPDKLVVTAISGLVAEVHQQMEANCAQIQQSQDVLDNQSRPFTNGSVLSNSSPVQIVTSEYREQSKEKSPQPIDKKDISLEDKELSPEPRDPKLELSLDLNKSVSDLNEQILDLDETIPDVDEQIVALNEQIPDVDEEIIELDEQVQDLVESSPPISDLISNHEGIINFDEPSSDLKELIDELHQRTSDLMASTPNIESSVIDEKETEDDKKLQLDTAPKVDNYEETRLISDLTEATKDRNEVDKDNDNASVFEFKVSNPESGDSSQLTSEKTFDAVEETTEESLSPKHLIPEEDKLTFEPLEVVTEKLDSKEIKDDMMDSTVDLNLETADDLIELTSDVVSNDDNLVKVTENLLNEARIVTTEELQEIPKKVKLSTPELLEEALKEEIVEKNDVEDIDHENASVKVIGMEVTAHSADGGAWPRAERPVRAPAPAPPPRPHEADEVKSIFLETEIPQQSRVLVADFEGTPASESPAPRHSPLVVSGKMTLSLIQDAPRDTPDRDLESTVDDFTTASGVTQPPAEKEDELSDEEIEEEIEIEEIEEEVEEEEEPEIEKK